MKLKSVLFLAIVGSILASVYPANAEIVNQTYYFTGADLLNNVFIDDGYYSDGSLNYFEGARLLRVGTDGGHDNVGKTYDASYHDNFTSRWNEYIGAGYVFDEFNLWGFAGNNAQGAYWGEDFKPYEWVSMTGPEGWTAELTTWPWGDPPDGIYTDKFPSWYGGQDYGFALDASDLANQKFSVTIAFDTDDMWWGNTLTAVQNAPNSLNELTMWFGGYITNYDDQGEYLDYHLYEGNMVAPVPEPTTMLLLGVGALGLAGLGRKKFIKK